MKDEDFQGIVSGIEDAMAFARGNGSRARVVRGLDVKAIRSKTSLSQVAFAELLHVSPATLRDWEQGRRTPDASARTLLGMVDADPRAAIRLLEKVAA